MYYYVTCPLFKVDLKLGKRSVPWTEKGFRWREGWLLAFHSLDWKELGYHTFQNKQTKLKQNRESKLLPVWPCFSLENPLAGFPRWKESPLKQTEASSPHQPIQLNLNFFLWKHFPIYNLYNIRFRKQVQALKALSGNIFFRVEARCYIFWLMSIWTEVPLCSFFPYSLNCIALQWSNAVWIILSVSDLGCVWYKLQFTSGLVDLVLHYGVKCKGFLKEYKHILVNFSHLDAHTRGSAPLHCTAFPTNQPLIIDGPSANTQEHCSTWYSEENKQISSKNNEM